jgi:hypothetical protein
MLPRAHSSAHFPRLGLAIRPTCEVLVADGSPVRLRIVPAFGLG